ncbi:unnamed protein product [Rotaria sordida]|uniref:Uncharacterized protein n=1 Tax=Rotaria sordida TaxID=392033 RepID=A0A814EGR0_9BILA|nr:unnamed protein product [Rotaria sordida]CAF1572498.1 unnamed protein product [Rotaria sordida]
MVDFLRFLSTLRIYPTLANYSFENLSRLIGCSTITFWKLFNIIPKYLTFLHMFFDSINDLNYFIYFNSNQLKSLGVGIQCQLNDIDIFCSLYNKYQWKRLIQFNLNLQD